MTTRTPTTTTLPQPPATANDASTNAASDATRGVRIRATGQPNRLLIYTRHLLGQYRRGAIFWALAVSLYCALMVLSFPAFEDSPALDMSNYPKALREAFNLDNLNLIEPYLSSQFFQMAPLALAFYPITVFAGAIAGAEERGKLDIMLGNPLPRRTVVLATWVAVALALLGILAVLGGTTWLAAVIVGVDLSARESFRGALNLWPVCMAFGGLALALSAAVRQRGVALGVPILVLFLMYLGDVLGKIIASLANLRYISAFKYYGDAIVNGMPWGGAALLTAVALLLLALAIPLFERRDINT